MFNYKWSFKDYPKEKNGYKVFSTFACGGGSTMGYKLAGYDVIGCNEIDAKMMEIYKANHHPKYSYLEDIRVFKDRKDLPDELYQLDILDGSPPCSSFSMQGNREADWGKEKKFVEGQALQVLDTLFFDFIDVAEKLKPKVVIAENVKGLDMGSAKNYVSKIYQAFDKAGYYVERQLFDSSTMGVPQRRERLFFMAMRKDIVPEDMKTNLFCAMPQLKFDFKEPKIPFGELYQPGIDDRPASQGKLFDYWKARIPGDKSFADTIKRTTGKSKIDAGLFGDEESKTDRENKAFTSLYLYKDQVSPTYTSNTQGLYLYDEHRKPNKSESCCIQTFPQDYNFLKSPYYYVIGMSVPPVMTAQISKQIQLQWLDKIEKNK